MRAPVTIALVAGEASGDQLGAGLIRALKRMHPAATFVGIGGSRMRAAGMDTWWDSENLAVFGLFEVVSHFPRLYRLRSELLRRLLQLRPDVFVGIDAPDFNLGVESRLKSADIRTAHYVSPTVWAWRPGRVKKIARAADLVMCLFPFEPAFYRGQGVEAVYVGHPMAEEIPLVNDAEAARRELGLNPSQGVVALLPGSRVSEVSRLSLPMIEASVLLKARFPGLQFVSASANETVGKIFREILAQHSAPQIWQVHGRAREVMSAADVVVCASGTATLETMLVNRPMVVAYRLAPATYHLARTLRLIKRQHFALPNILAGETLVPELIQEEASGERLALETMQWLQDPASCEQLRERFAGIHQELRTGSSERAAEAICGLLLAKA